jgi:hypothetical protein
VAVDIATGLAQLIQTFKGQYQCGCQFWFGSGAAVFQDEATLSMPIIDSCASPF